jgi:hypothetical protein
MLFLGWVNIRFFGCGGWRFRPYGESLFQTPKRNQKAGPLRSAPRCGSAFLRSGIHPGASPTVCFAAPPLDACGCAARSLRSHPRINPSTQPSDGAGRSKAVLELTLIVLSGERPKQKQRQRQRQRQRQVRDVCFVKSKFTTVCHVGVALPNNTVSSLSFRERARVRGLLRLFKYQQPNRILPTRFSGCPSEVRSLVFGCRRKLCDRV